MLVRLRRESASRGWLCPSVVFLYAIPAGYSAVMPPARVQEFRSCENLVQK
jgi:hypothetical protein